MESDPGDVLLVATGDEAALGRLLVRWRQPVYAIFERTRQPSAAVEAAVGVFVALVDGAESYAAGQPFEEWIYTLVWNRMREEPATDRVELSPRRLADSMGARTAMLRAAVAALPPADRALFLLTRIAKLPTASAARVVGVPEDEARRHVVRAMDALRRSLGGLLELAVAGGDATTSGAPR